MDASQIRAEFILKWQEVGKDWGVPKAMLSVHAWLLTHQTAQSTDEVMAALNLSRGSAHTMLSLLVDWKLAYPVKSLGRRQIRYLAERDGHTMMMGILAQRIHKELDPLIALDQWRAAHSSDMRKAGFSAFDEQLKSWLQWAQWVKFFASHGAYEGESWWKKWLLKPLTKA